MKTNVLKFVLPLAVVAVGLTSAASTSSLTESSKAAAQAGFRHIANPNDCVEEQQCDEGGSWNCKASLDGVQLYNSSCNTPLKRSTPN
jgi:hypothetical protein